MAQYGFGSGSMWGVAAGSNPTPGRFGGLQEASVDFNFNTKELHGQYQFPIAVARGTGKIAGKAKYAQLQGRLMNDLFFSSTLATGREEIADNESGTIATGAVTVANSATWTQDLGVIDASTGIPFVRVASAPATGQYSVAAGVYSFNTGQNGVAVKISYAYTVAASGQKITIANQLLGVAPTFKAVMTQLYGGMRTTLSLNAAVSAKISFATKLEDFQQPEFDFAAFADSANNIGTWSFAEAS